MSDGERYIEIDGRRWRRADPAIPPALKKALVSELMSARRAVKAAMADDDDDAEEEEADDDDDEDDDEEDDDEPDDHDGEEHPEDSGDDEGEEHAFNIRARTVPEYLGPGSFERDDIGADYYDTHDDVPGQRILTCRAGTMTLMHNALWHRVEPNRSGVERLIRNTGSMLDARGIELYRRLVADPQMVVAPDRIAGMAVAGRPQPWRGPAHDAMAQPDGVTLPKPAQNADLAATVDQRQA